jgi:glycosyltransferase involved in cell wall biosynthesis
MNNIPVKVFESWACGLPVIATDLPPIRPFFAARGLGLLVRPGSAEELAEAIEQLLASPHRVAEFGRRARQVVVERYNADVEIRKLMSFYAKVLSC